MSTDTHLCSHTLGLNTDNTFGLMWVLKAIKALTKSTLAIYCCTSVCLKDIREAELKKKKEWSEMREQRPRYHNADSSFNVTSDSIFETTHPQFCNTSFQHVETNVCSAYLYLSLKLHLIIPSKILNTNSSFSCRTYPSRLLWCELPSFGDIGQRDVCLRLKII